MYDHSGVTISTTPFSCPWDSGQIGFAIVTKEELRKEFSVKRITKELTEKATKILLNEVEVYDQYLKGDVYGFKVLENDEETDSCFGFFGDDFATNGIADNLSEKLAKALKAA